MIREKNTTISTSLSYQELRDLVAAASTIAERLSGDFFAEDTSDSEDLRQQRFDGWCRIVAAEDRERFREILSWDGHDITEVRLMLGHVQLHEHAPLPAWTTTLQEALHLVETISCENGVVDKSSWRFLSPDKPYPFEELLSPFAVVAQQRYTEQLASTSHLLSAEAHCILQRHLLQVLTSLSVDTLHTTFSHWREEETARASGQIVQQSGDAANEYQQFITWMYQGGWVSFLRTYSFLGRLLATTTDLWVEAQIEFYQRLEADWQEIQQTFGGNDALGQVTAIEPALSDPHHGRRCVMALTFASGRRLIYKPRNIGMEVCYSSLLNWCNERGATPPFKVLATIDRSSYGWVELVEHAPCSDQQTVQHYYQRTGMLLCLAYILGGVDCSYERVIASGEHAILIDPTILLHHYPCPDHQDESLQRQCSDWEQAQFSVLHTGLLSSWQMSIDSARNNTFRPYPDISGIALSGPKNGVGHEHKQLQPQGQSLALKCGMLRSRERLNMPMSSKPLLPLIEYREAICAGFTHLYQLLLSNCSTLQAIDSPLQAFRQQQVRVVYRVSDTYHGLLSKLLKPEYMRDGVAYNIEMERLWQEHIPVEYMLWRDGNSARWRLVYQAEQQALLQGDIPFFIAQADSDVLVANGKIASCLHQPSFDLLLKRVAQLSDGDMRLQIGLIQQALHTRVTPMIMGIKHDQSADDDVGNKTLTSNAFLAQALAIADSIAEQAIPMNNEAVTWIQPRFLMRSRRYQLQPARSNTFNGVCGIALFLAAAAKASSEDKYRMLAQAAVRPLCQSLHEDGEFVAREMGIGGTVGLGSVMYALTRISQFLDAPELLMAASEAAHEMNPEHIANDQALDIIAGSAGAILGLLALYDTTHEQFVLDRAITCGRHLLQARTMSKAGCLAWPTLRSRHTTGFSHGTAGIVYALLRLYAITGDAKLLDAAKEGLIYEDQAFVSRMGNWAEELSNLEVENMATWCHGAPGIGLARIGGLPILDNARIRQDIEIALQTTQRVSIQGADHLCCGNSGRAEILLTAAQKLGRPDLADVARQNMWSILTRAEQKKTFLLDASLPRWVPSIDLFRGISGIGYTFLRLVSPDTLPSVLLWE